MSIGSFMAAFLAKPPLSPIRGLYTPPEGGEVYPDHRSWAGHQPLGPNGIMALALVALNPINHRCRIGKVTLKQALLEGPGV